MRRDKRNLKRFLTEDLQPLLRGWASYFSVAETRRVFEDLDEWVRRKLRCMEWRKWKRGRTRYRKLLALGFTKEKARVCAFNGRGAWPREVFPLRHGARVFPLLHGAGGMPGLST